MLVVAIKMAGHQYHYRCNSDIDDQMLLFDCLPPSQTPLQNDHPLQAVVPTLASRGLRDFGRSRASKTARGLNNLHLNTKTKCPHLRRQRTAPTNLPRCLACPFYKLDSQRHQDCLGTEFPSMRSLKQHIIIDHHAPISCPVCHASFDSATHRDEHIVARTCVERDQERDFLAGVNEDQVEKLMLRDNISRSALRRRGQGSEQTREVLEEQRWFQVWDIVFPGEPRPASAYLTTPREREAVALRVYWRRHAPKLIHAALKEEDRRDEKALEALQASVLKDMMELGGVLES